MDVVQSALIFFVAGPAIAAGALLWVLRGPKVPPWLDLTCSFALLVLTAIFLGMIESINSVLPDSTYQQKDLIAQYQVALYIVPFFTGGIATNIISHVLLHNRDYAGTVTFRDAAKSAAKGLLLAVLVLSVFGIVF
jgi:hypothetical protein